MFSIFSRTEYRLLKMEGRNGKDRVREDAVLVHDATVVFPSFGHTARC